MNLPTLPARADPHADESLLSLAFRGAQASKYPSASWIGDLIGQDLLAAHRNPAMVPKFASCFQMTRKEILRRMYYLVGRKSSAPMILGAPLRNFWGHNVPEELIDTTRVWLCPTCYSQSPYLRSTWSLALYRACHVHRTWLVHQCVCKKEIDYRRRRLERCPCGRNILDQATAAPDPAVDLAEQLYRRVHPDGPLARIGSAPKEFSSASFGEFVTGMALLMARHLQLSTSHGFAGLLSEFRDLSPGRFAGAAAEALAILEEWPQKLDEQLIRGLRVVDRRIEIERIARMLIKPFVTWALPKSLEFLTSRLEPAIGRRREGVLRSILGEEFRQGDERLMVPISDAAQKLGLPPDHIMRVLSCYVPRESIATRTGREIVVTDADDLDTLVRGLKLGVRHAFEDELVETVSFKEASWISQALGVGEWDLLRALAAAEIEFLACAGAAVSLTTIRINYQALLQWCRSNAVRPREWLRFSGASKVAVMRVQAFEQMLSKEYVVFRGEAGLPDQREICAPSLIEFRTNFRLLARTVMADRLGRSGVTARLAKKKLKSIVDSDTSRTIMLAVSDIKSLAQ